MSPTRAGQAVGGRRGAGGPGIGGAPARRILGNDVGDPTDPVWGFDEEGEMRGMWRPTGQQGLWFLAGGLAQCRIFSKVLALQIKARELGITV
jgi:hypothetical protein